MRNHGWHLPYHPLQIVAVAVFSALAFSFYVFFVPFVGSSVLKFHIIAAFSPLVLAVFILYVRCAAIDPADSGIRRAKQRAAATRKLETSAEILLQDAGRVRNTAEQMEEEINRNLQMEKDPEGLGWKKPQKVVACLCCPVVLVWKCIPGRQFLEDFILGNRTEMEKYIPEEELLYCSLCEAEILKCSKHCRACDKCVDGFDHHCRWLNNCIGKKNYKTFVAVMVASLFMLVMEWSIGIYVLVRCFSNEHKFDKEIVQKLGSSFTRTPFIVVVTLCTILALLATLPLAQLLFFHLILIKKGITTYDYIVAIREQETPIPAVEAHVGRTPSSSPASSVATAASGGSSVGALQRAVWCTPPRMFVENQADMKAGVVVQYATPLWTSSILSMDTQFALGTGRERRAEETRITSPLSSKPNSDGMSTGASPRMDLEIGAGMSSRPLKDAVSGQRRPIGLSPWKLARLSTKEATRAASRARENSSILRPVKYIESSAVTENEDSSFESSAEISTRGGHKVGWRLEIPLSRDRPGLGNEHNNPLYSMSLSTERRYGQVVEEKGTHPLNPLHSEATSPFRSRSLNTMTSFPLTASATESPDNFASPDLATGEVQLYHNANPERSWLSRAMSDGYEASGGESADDTSDQGHRLSQAWGKLKLNTSVMGRHDRQSATIKWSSGLEDVAASESQPESRASSTCETRSNGSRVEANIMKHVKDWPAVRDKVSTSTDGSDNSSPCHYSSPQQRMSPDIHPAFTICSHLDKSSSKESGATLHDPCPEGSPKSKAGKRGLSSARRLKESILSYKRGLSSSSRSGSALLSTSR